MASKRFNELRQLFLEYEGESDNLLFWEEVVRAKASTSGMTPPNTDRMKQIEEIIETLLG